jgi:hypothetical protein
MSTKKEQLQTLAAAISLLADGDIPHGVNGSSYPDRWNEARQAILAGFPLLGDFFADTDGGLGTLLARFNLDHATDGSNLPPNEWVADSAPPVFVNSGQFQLAGDRRTDYAVGHRVRAMLGTSPVIVAVTGVSYDGSTTTVSVTPASLTSQLAAVARGLVRTSMPRVVAADLMPAAVTTDGLADQNVTAEKLAVHAATPTRVSYPGITPNVVVAASWQTVGTLNAFTTRGGAILLLGSIAGSLVGGLLNGVGALHVEVQRAGVTFRTLRAEFLVGGGQTAPVLIPLATEHSPGAGSHLYSVRAKLTVSGGNPVFTTDATNPGYFSAVELA